MKSRVTWDGVFDLCSAIKSKTQRPDIIICIANGGLIPSAIIAKLYRVYKVYNIGVKSYDTTDTRRLVQMYYEPNLIHEDRNQRILVVDDILDSGNTFNYIENYLNQKGFKDFSFASLHYKSGIAQQHIPSKHVYGTQCDSNTWIVYPWETIST